MSCPNSSTCYGCTVSMSIATIRPHSHSQQIIHTPHSTTHAKHIPNFVVVFICFCFNCGWFWIFNIIPVPFHAHFLFLFNFLPVVPRLSLNYNFTFWLGNGKRYRNYWSLLSFKKMSVLVQWLSLYFYIFIFINRFYIIIVYHFGLQHTPCLTRFLGWG